MSLQRLLIFVLMEGLALTLTEADDQGAGYWRLFAHLLTPHTLKTHILVPAHLPLVRSVPAPPLGSLWLGAPLPPLSSWRERYLLSRPPCCPDLLFTLPPSSLGASTPYPHPQPCPPLQVGGAPRAGMLGLALQARGSGWLLGADGREGRGVRRQVGGEGGGKRKSWNQKGAGHSSFFVCFCLFHAFFGF